MKNFYKRTLCIALILCTFACVCMTEAADASESPYILGTGSSKNTETPSPMSSDVVLDRNISSNSLTWYQPGGYPSYRVWVENTTNYIMTVRITSPRGLTTTFLVPAGGNNRCVSNNAVEGGHELTFSTTGNVVSGTVKVRVSTMPLT